MKKPPRIEELSKVLPGELKVETRVSQFAIYPQPKTHRKRTQIKLYTLFGRTCKVTTQTVDDKMLPGRKTCRE